MKTLGKAALQLAALIAVLFIVALITRFPALQYAEVYGLHAILAAPLYALSVSLFLRAGGSFLIVVVGSLVFGAVLGSLQVIMAVPVLASTGVSSLAFLVTRRLNREKTSLITGFLYGAVVYPATLLGGFLFGGYVTGGSFEAILYSALLVLLSVALSFFGAIAGITLGGVFTGYHQKRVDENEHT